MKKIPCLKHWHQYLRQMDTNVNSNKCIITRKKKKKRRHNNPTEDNQTSQVLNYWCHMHTNHFWICCFMVVCVFVCVLELNAQVFVCSKLNFLVEMKPSKPEEMARIYLSITHSVEYVLIQFYSISLRLVL